MTAYCCDKLCSGECCYILAAQLQCMGAPASWLDSRASVWTARARDMRKERDELRDRLAKLESALSEALDRWAEASQYKGEFLANKHGDAEDIAEIRALLMPHEST